MKTVPPEKLEPIIFKLAISDSKYANLITEDFEKSWFEDTKIGEILEICLKFFQKYNSFPTLETLDLIVSKRYQDEYKDLIKKVRAIYNLDIEKYNKEYLDEQIINYLKNAGLYWIIMSSIDRIEKSHSVEHCLEKLQKISSLDFNHDLGFQYFEEIDDHLKELSNPQSNLSTGWDSLDKVLNGGLLKDGRFLMTFIGESHIGKSLFLSNIAANMLKMDKFVILISLEMSELMFGARIDSHLSEVDINSVKFNTEKIKDSIEKIKKENLNAKLIIKEFPPETISCNHIKNYIDKIISSVNRDPDIIIIDYINQLIPNGGGNISDNSYEKIGKVCKQMRSLSYVYNVPIVTASQVNREGYNSTNVKLDTISDSMGIAHTSDVILSIWQNDGDKENEIIRTTILKNRIGGRVGKTIEYNIDYSSLRIKDIGTRKLPKNMEKEIEDLKSI